MNKSEYPLSDDHKQKISESLKGDKNGMSGRQHTEESKRKMSERAKGRKCDPEVVAKRSEKLKGIVRAKRTCPFCGKEVAANTYAQWHGDNCKENPAADLSNRKKLSEKMRNNNPMKNPEVASKLSGDDHWTRTNPEKVLRGDNHWMNTNPEAKERFLENHPNKDGAVSRRTSEIGHNVFQTNNPRKRKS